MCNGGGSCVFGACQCFNDDDYYWPTTGLCEPPTVVGAGVVCLGNGESRRPIEIDGSLRTLEGDTDAEGGWLSACDEDVTYGTCTWNFVSKVDIAAATGWPAETNGIYQSSNAWGNYNGDNSLMGCNLLKTEQTYVNFILEATVVNLDNDGVGFVFGWALDRRPLPGDHDRRHLAGGARRRHPRAVHQDQAA